MIGRSELPLDLISSFLRENFVDLKGDLSVSRTEGGFSNPTYFVRVGDWQAVLRKQPASVSVKSAHAIDREFRVMSALHGSGVPVPKPLLYHEAKDVLDTPFYIMEKIIKETTRLLLQGTITKEIADKILLDLHSVSNSATQVKSSGDFRDDDNRESQAEYFGRK